MNAEATNSPLDITGEIGPMPLHVELFQGAAWPMYSFARPAYYLWNAIANGLHRRGWNEDRIKRWLQGKGPRRALDGSLGEDLEKLGARYAKQLAEEAPDL